MTNKMRNHASSPSIESADSGRRHQKPVLQKASAQNHQERVQNSDYEAAEFHLPVEPGKSNESFNSSTQEPGDFPAGYQERVIRANSAQTNPAWQVRPVTWTNQDQNRPKKPRQKEPNNREFLDLPYESQMRLEDQQKTRIPKPKTPVFETVPFTGNGKNRTG